MKNSTNLPSQKAQDSHIKKMMLAFLLLIRYVIAHPQKALVFFLLAQTALANTRELNPAAAQIEEEPLAIGHYPSSIDVATMDLRMGMTVSGETDGDNFGYSLATGDIDGDGHPDLLIGEHNSFTDVEQGGKIHLLRNIAGLPLAKNMSISEIRFPTRIEFLGTRAGDHIGIDVAAIDVNGDGYDDIAVTVNRAQKLTNPDSIVGYVRFGSPNLSEKFSYRFNASELDGSNGFTVTATDGLVEGTDNYFNIFRVINAGDINHDGVDDLAISMPYYMLGTTSKYGGLTAVIFGRHNSTFPAEIDLSHLGSPEGLLLWGEAGTYSGMNLLAGFDLNRDGYDDFAIMIPENNALKSPQTDVIKGGPNITQTLGSSGGNVFPLSSLTLNEGNIFTCATCSYTMQGYYASSIFSKDGNSTYIALGWQSYLGDSSSSDKQGLVRVVQTSANFDSVQSFELTQLNGENGFNVWIPKLDEGTNVNFGSLGNFSRDTTSDSYAAGRLALHWNTTNQASMYLIFNHTFTNRSPLLNVSDPAEGLIVSEVSTSSNVREPFFGLSTSLYDWNGDGHLDFLMGSPIRNSFGNLFTGQLHIIFGGDEPPILYRNKITIEQGGNVTLSEENLYADDKDHQPSPLIYNITSLGPHLDFVDESGQPVRQFTPSDIQAGRITVTHDGLSKEQPYYSLTVSDGQMITSPVPGQITLRREPPTLDRSTIKAYYTRSNLNASELDVHDTLVPDSNITLSIIRQSQYGIEFFKAGQPVFNFTMDDIVQLRVSKALIPGQGDPQLAVEIVDGYSYNPPPIYSVTVIPVRVPEVHCRFDVLADQSQIITWSELNATDYQTPPAQFEFYPKKLEGAQIDPASSFTGDDLLNSYVRLTPESKGNLISLAVSVTGGVSSLPGEGVCDIWHYYSPVIRQIYPPEINANDHQFIKIDSRAFVISAEGWGVNPSVPDSELRFYLSDERGGEFQIDFSRVKSFTWSDVLAPRGVYFQLDQSNRQPSAIIQLGNKHFNSTPVAFTFVFTPKPPHVSKYREELEKIMWGILGSLGTVLAGVFWVAIKQKLQSTQKKPFMKILQQKQAELIEDSGDIEDPYLTAVYERIVRPIADRTISYLPRKYHLQYFLYKQSYAALVSSLIFELERQQAPILRLNLDKTDNLAFIDHPQVISTWFAKTVQEFFETRDYDLPENINCMEVLKGFMVLFKKIIRCFFLNAAMEEDLRVNLPELAQNIHQRVKQDRTAVIERAKHVLDYRRYADNVAQRDADFQGMFSNAYRLFCPCRHKEKDPHYVRLKEHFIPRS